MKNIISVNFFVLMNVKNNLLHIMYLIYKNILIINKIYQTKVSVISNLHTYNKNVNYTEWMYCTYVSVTNILYMKEIKQDKR